MSAEENVLALTPFIPETSDARLAVHGGDPIGRTPWPACGKGAVFVNPADEEAALHAIRSHLFFRYDHRAQHETECGRVEQDLCRFFGARYALATSSGTTALALAVRAARIPPGSLIVCPGFTFVATPVFIFRVVAGDAKWFAHALCCEGIDACNLGSDEDTNVRVFWNWRFMFATADVPRIQALLPNTTRYLRQAVDVPLSSTLCPQDCAHLVAAARRVAGGLQRGRCHQVSQQ